MGSEQPRVLILNAEPGTASALERALAPKGCLLRVAGGIDRIAAELPSFNPDLLVLETDLSSASALQAVSDNIGRLQELDVSTVVVARPTADLAVICRGFDLGVEEYLFHPLQEAEVAARIGLVLRRRDVLFQRVQSARLEGVREVSAGLVGRLEEWLSLIEMESRMAREEILPVAPGRSEVRSPLMRIERIREALNEIRETATLIGRLVEAVPATPARMPQLAAGPVLEPGRHRRAGPRVTPSALVTVHHGENRFSCLAYQMNEGGMFLQSPLQIPPLGSRLKVEVHTSGPTSVPPLEAVVVRVSTSEAPGPGTQPLGVGIRFENLSRETVEAIRTYLRRLGAVI